MSENTDYKTQRAQKALNIAVEFYEADQKLTLQDRKILHKLFFTIDNQSTLFTTVFAVIVLIATTFLRRRISPESSIMSYIILGIASVAATWKLISLPIKNYLYNRGVAKIRHEHPQCYLSASFLTANQALQWEHYYGITQTHPEQMLKDPRLLSEQNIKSLSKLLK